MKKILVKDMDLVIVVDKFNYFFVEDKQVISYDYDTEKYLVVVDILNNLHPNWFNVVCKVQKTLK